jgi:hypothetical protein
MKKDKMERERAEKIVKEAGEMFIKTFKEGRINLSNEAEEQLRESLFRLTMKDVERLYELV